ncbi:MAG TPA: hypothetical protein VGH60_05530 [Solirubrobacteraceae bacterium]
MQSVASHRVTEALDIAAVRIPSALDQQNLVTGVRELERKRDARRTGADDGDLCRERRSRR